MFLALDTATDRPTLALGAPRDPGSDVRIASRRDLSRDIERVAGRLLYERGIQIGSLSGIVVADGPGSFTGLRIGIAFAKALCRALGVPLLAAPSLLGAARAAALGAATVYVAYDALRGEVYRALYRLPDRASVASGGSEPVLVLLAPALARAGDDVPAAGDLVVADARSASAAALLSLVGVPNGAAPVPDPMTWEPAYGRLAEAEARYRAGADPFHGA
ncbi:MAG: tRNA (adenosine(37)-N6)-threonylcarbamoyltransferase complex dimerization subunit type 1 TsaB [Gemmatimonadetes bacterium]|nr:tRNA (adenosine(37)-N6)-threonylcarbamoyltransferase complex dimerization subunit type 1 TsaB [Gemmatimonadota bacterium]